MDRTLIRRCLRVGLIVALIAPISCEVLLPTVSPEDSGNGSFVRQAVPILHGRKVRGYDEVKLLSDLIGITDRELVLRALMAQPQFVDHWADTLVDDLRIDRETDLGFPQQQACYATPSRSLPVGGGIASAILNSAPQTAAAGGSFNMADVVRSSIELDNLYPIYRINLYPHVGIVVSATDELNRRDVIGAKFGEIYLNRQMGCLICHNSEFSLSGPSSGWNRTWPIRGLFEKALFTASTGEPTRNAYAAFRSDNLGGPLSPWGLQNCGTFKTTLGNDPQGVTEVFGSSQGQQFGVHQLQQILHSGYLGLKQNGLQRTLSPQIQATCSFCTANCQGATLDINAAANNAPNAAQVKSILINHCQSCHGGAANLYITSGNDWAADMIAVASAQKSGETLVIPGNASGSYLMKKLTNAPGIVGSRMPLAAPALSSSDIALITAWINGLPQLTACAPCQSTDCAQPPQEVAADEAFAFLTAARLADSVWQDVMGYPVTIANYFPRNPDQRDVLWNLTEYKLVPSNWSLRDLLVRIMTSNFFNRVAPKSTTASTAYNVPPVYDPWIVADPRVPPASDPGYDPTQHPQDHKNAMSDAVYRYSARSLTNSVHEALGWPAPLRYPGNTYPSQDLMRSIGFYFSEQQPGFQTVDFQGLLAWETVHGTCVRPVGVTNDWVDRLMAAIAAFPANDPGGPLSVGDVATAMRDWLLGYGTIGTTPPLGLSASEADAIKALFGVAALTDPVSGVSNLEPKLRQLCGIQLESPQFQLAGIAEDGLGTKPRLRACNTADCTYQQMCQALQPAVNALLGHSATLRCGTDSVSILTITKEPPPWWVKLCPSPICGTITKWIPEGCPILGAVRDTRASFGACPVQPPTCDPRCSRIDCCGGPIPRQGLKQRDTLVVWADGGEVITAQGAQIRGANAFEPLQAGRKLKTGDLIALPPGSRFELRTTDGARVGTPAEGLPKDTEQPTIAMMISGPGALRERERVSTAKVPLDKIRRILEAPHTKFGEGGAPLTAERRRSYAYSAQELGLNDLRKRGLLPEQLKKKAE